MRGQQFKDVLITLFETDIDFEKKIRSTYINWRKANDHDFTEIGLEAEMKRNKVVIDTYKKKRDFFLNNISPLKRELSEIIGKPWYDITHDEAWIVYNKDAW